MTEFLNKHRNYLFFAFSLAALLLILRWIEYQYLLLNYRLELYSGFLAIVFTALGIWLSNRLSVSPKTSVTSSQPSKEQVQKILPQEKEIEKIGLSTRELEVLQQMSLGLSNQEIADQLFVSLNTIKTHNSNILSKMNVKRRMQAVEKARTLGMLQKNGAF